MNENLKYITIWFGLRPTDPQYGLMNSVPIIGSPDTRVCYDQENNEIIVFMEHSQGRYHGVVRYLDKIESDIKTTLLDNFDLKFNQEPKRFVSSFENNNDLKNSLDNVKTAIISKDYEYIKYIMPAIGRDGIYSDDLKEIIELCTHVDDDWVQRSAYICLYNIIIRYEGFAFDDFLYNIIVKNFQNESIQVKSIINRINLFCREFDVSL